MEFPSLNKFEKEKKVIELHAREGKTLKEIATVVHMSFRDISKIIKAYDKKVRRLQTKKEQENNQTTTKKLSLSTQAFKLFIDNKKPDEVKILLDIPFKKAMQFWAQYLKSIRMFESYEFYQEYSYDIPTLLSIAGFCKRNDISGKGIVNILYSIKDISNLYQIHSNLKAEIKNLEQKRMTLSYYSHSPYSLQPLPSNKYKYNYYSY